MEGVVNFTAAPLVAVAQALGIVTTTLAEHERPEVLSISGETQSANLLALQLNQLTAVVESYGTAFRMQILTNELPELTVADGMVPADRFETLQESGQAW